LIVPATPVRPATESDPVDRVPEVTVVKDTVFVATAVTVHVPFSAVSGDTSDATVIFVPTGYFAPAPEEVIVAVVPVRETAVIVEAAFEAPAAVVMLAAS
jgi:hypothetical protein